MLCLLFYWMKCYDEFFMLLLLSYKLIFNLCVMMRNNLFCQILHWDIVILWYHFKILPIWNTCLHDTIWQNSCFVGSEWLIEIPVWLLGVRIRECAIMRCQTTCYSDSQSKNTTVVLHLSNLRIFCTHHLSLRHFLVVILTFRN